MALIKCPDCGQEVSDQAMACLKCGRPVASITAPSARPLSKENIRANAKEQSSKLKFAAVLVLGIIIYIACHSIPSDTSYTSTDTADTSTQPMSDNKPVPTASSELAPSPQVVMDTMPAQLYELYAMNEVRADNDLAGKAIQVTAPVLSIDKDVLNDIVLQFSTGRPFQNMTATLDNSQNAAAANLIPQQIVTIQCKDIHRVLDSPTADRCVLLSTSKGISAE